MFVSENYYHDVFGDSFQDGNGYIDEQELDALLRDLYQTNKKVRRVFTQGDQTYSLLVHTEKSAMGRFKRSYDVWFGDRGTNKKRGG